MGIGRTNYDIALNSGVRNLHTKDNIRQTAILTPSQQHKKIKIS